MSVEQRIIRHVEETEFLKEIARREADRILKGADVDELINDPGGFVEQLLAAILIALGDRAEAMSEEARDYAVSLGLSALAKAEIETVRNQSDDTFLAIAIPALLVAAEPARRQVESMLAGGIAAATIEGSLESEATRDALFASFGSALRSSVATYVQELDRAVVDFAMEETDEERFQWIAIMDGSTCDDRFDNSCAPRHGETFTLDEWDDFGRPGAPQLICSIYAKAGSYCRCVLASESIRPKLLNPVRIDDAIAAGKARAEALYVR